MTILIRTLVCLLVILHSQTSFSQRDPLLWPFAVNSIWNTPIGSNAVYVPAGIEPANAYGMTVDEDLIVLKPQAPLLDIYTNYAGWDADLDRCVEEGPLLFTAPVPIDFIVSPDNWDGLTPNSGLAVLMPDGETIRQTQPFSRCSAETATSRWTPPNVNLYGDGIRGAHGGSGLSAIGGALRLGELDEPDDTIRHVLKVNLYAAENLFYDSQYEGFRWPAIRADSYAPDVYGSLRTEEVVPECRMGALLAIPAQVDLSSLALETTPAQILALALQQYGAYVVDDTAWDVYAFITEWSPDGRFMDEFEAAWGFPFKEPSQNTSWSRDMRTLFSALHVVDNNRPDNIGGGGTPLTPLAPEFSPNSVMDEKPNTQLIISPNPAHGQVVLSGLPLNTNLLIVNALGQKVHSETLTQTTLALPLSHPNGYYNLLITTSNGKVLERKPLIIQN